MNVLNYKGYQGRFEYDPEEEIFHGEVMHLADVVTFQGKSVEELKQALADSIEDYLELCASMGKKPEKPYSGRFNVRIPPELHQRIVSRALRDGKSLNAWVAEVLDHAAQKTGRL
jgi:predicted HicB family RNase H-like nuclease